MKEKTRMVIKKVNKELKKKNLAPVKPAKDIEKQCRNCGQKALIQTGTCHTCQICGESGACG